MTTPDNTPTSPISDADGNQIGYSISKTDSKGRVLRQTEIIAEEIRTILRPYVDNLTEIANNATKGVFITPPNPNDRPLSAALAEYVLNKIHENYAHDVRLGVDMGRNEMLAVMETVIGEDDEHTMLSAKRLRAEQRKRLSQAVAAVSKSTEAKG